MRVKQLSHLTHYYSASDAYLRLLDDEELSKHPRQRSNSCIKKRSVSREEKPQMWRTVYMVRTGGNLSVEHRHTSTTICEMIIIVMMIMKMIWMTINYITTTNQESLRPSLR